MKHILVTINTDKFIKLEHIKENLVIQPNYPLVQLRSLNYFLLFKLASKT